MEKVSNENNDLISKQKTQIEMLEQRIAQASDTINNQNATITSFSTAYTVAGWLLGIFALISSVGIYMFGIRPSEKALENFDNNMDKRITKYFELKSTNNLEIAIKNIESNDKSLIDKGFYYIQFNLNEGLPKIYILRLLNVLRSSKTTNTTKHSVAVILGFLKDDDIKNYFNEILINDTISWDNNVKNTAFIYFLKPEYRDEGYLIIKKLILKSKKPGDAFMGMIMRIKQNENKYISLKLLNDQDLVNIALLPQNSTQDLISINQANSYFNLYQYISKDELSNTLYFKNYQFPEVPKDF